MTKLEQDFNELTQNVQNVKGKPALRDTIAVNLTRMGHPVEDVDKLLDSVYQTTVH